MGVEVVILAISGAFFLGHGLKWLFEKTLIPDVLMLGILGFIVGPVLQLVSVEDLGPAGQILATTTLIVILYECGLNLKACQLRQSSLPALALSVCSFFLTGVMGFLVGLAFMQSWEIALLFGIGIGGTSSAVVMPMVSRLPVSDSTRVVLNLESAFTDILTIVFFLVFSQSIVSGSFSVQHLMIQVGPNTLLAVLIGVGFGLVWAVLKKQFVRQIPTTFAGEAFALFVYGGTQVLGYNGAISVLALGFTLANLDLGPQMLGRFIHRQPVSTRNLLLLEQITMVLSTFFFIYLGLLIQISHLQFVLVAVLATGGILLVRYVSCRMLFMNKMLPLASAEAVPEATMSGAAMSASTKMRHLSSQEALIITAMGPRGLACAVLALMVMQSSLQGREWLQEAMIAVIPVSIIATSLLVAFSSRPFFKRRVLDIWF